MAQPLFDPDKCNIPEVPSLGFDFLSDCSLPEPPPPIFDCPLPVLPRDPAPLCPEFSAQVHLKTNYTDCSDKSDSAAIVFTQIDDDPCRFFVDLDLNLAIPRPPCPVVEVGSAAMVVEYADCLPVERRGMELAVTRQVYTACREESASAPGEDGCRITLDLVLGVPLPRVPCPEISVGEFSVRTDWADCITGPSALTITRNEPQKKCFNGGANGEEEACQFTVDLDLQIPIPRIPCPVLSATGTIAYGEEPELLFTANVTEPETTCLNENGSPAPCGLDFELNLVVPCPQITASFQVTAITANAEPSGGLTVYQGTGGCNFNISGLLQVPRGCVPRFWCSEKYRKPTDPPFPAPPSDCSYIEMLAPGEEPYSTLTFERTPAPHLFPPPNDCDYEIGMDIGIPCPDITAVVDVTAITASEAPTASFTVETIATTGICSYLMNLALKVPQACVPRFWCSQMFLTEDDTNGVPANCSKITRLAANQEAYVHLTFEKAPGTLYFDPPYDCDYEIGLDIGLPVTGITVVTDITCVSGELIVTKETVDIVLAPPA